MTEQPAAESPLIVRPRRGPTGGPGASLAAAGSLVAGSLYSLRFQGTTRLIIVALAAAAAVATAALIKLGRRRAHITLAAGRVTFGGLLRDRLVLGDADGRIVDVEVIWGPWSGRSSRLRLYIDRIGRTRLAVNLAAWDATSLELLRRRQELPVESISKPLRAAELRSLYPGSVPWWGAHPTATTVIVIVVATAVAIS